MEEPNKNPEVNSLETDPTAAASEAAKVEDSKKDDKKPSKKGSIVQRIIGHFNIYFLIFLLLVIIIAVVTFISYNRQKNNLTPVDIPSQQLDESAFGQIQSGDSSVGDAKQTLTVQSNAIFSGQVLARNDLEIAGNLKVGQTLNLPGLIVSGDSTLDQIQAKQLSLEGDAIIQGQLSVSRNLTVNGTGSFSGPVSAPTISVDSLQLSGDLQFTRHIDAGGATPSKTNGSALGNGGTASVSGTDTAGSIAVNTGGSAGAGCFVTLRFVAAFSNTPHVVVTPVGANGGAVNFYVVRSVSEFSVCTSNSPPSNSNFGFDYIVID